MPRSRGFTLVEIAVVVALIAILLAAGAKIASGLIEGAAVSVTQKKQQAIREALINFLSRNKRLPCPDTDFGIGNTLGFTSGPPDGRENRDAASAFNCAYPFGVVPFEDLGLPREIALDGWQNYFSYRVTEDYSWNKTGTFNDGSKGSIEVKARNADGTEKVIATTADGAVFAIVSAGRDGAGAFTTSGTVTLPPSGADEQANAALAAFGMPLPTPMPTLWARDATDNTGASGGPFNDVVLYVRASALLGSTNADLDFQDKIARARIKVLGEAIATCILPADTYALQITDIWGNPIAYDRIFDFKIPGTGPSVDAFTLTYPGRPTVTVSTAEVRGYLGPGPYQAGGVCVT